MPTLDEMMIDYEAEMIRDADARDARRATPGTVEYAMDRRAAARREREAALMDSADLDADLDAEDEDEDEDE
jgi:hypothetical protein